MKLSIVQGLSFPPINAVATDCGLLGGSKVWSATAEQHRYLDDQEPENSRVTHLVFCSLSNGATEESGCSSNGTCLDIQSFAVYPPQMSGINSNLAAYSPISSESTAERLFIHPKTGD